MLLLLRYPAYIDVQQMFTVQNKPWQSSSKAPKETRHPSFLRFELGRNKMMRLYSAENVQLKQKLANIRKWIARSYYLAFIIQVGSFACIVTHCRAAQR